MSDSRGRNIRSHRRFVELRATLEETLANRTLNLELTGLDLDTAVRHVADRFEKLIESGGAAPVFDAKGLIPPMQSCTEVEASLWFGWNAHREELLKRVREWVGLAKAVKARRLLLDGSFVTAKDKPGDVDAVVFLPKDFRDQVGAGKHEALELTRMFATRQPEELFAAEDEEDWWGWFEFFSRTREPTGRRKGLIEVAL